MEGFIIEAAGLLLRWLHVVAAIAWIGESFYFVALDRGLKPAKQPQPGLYGESWSVHGGGFYHKQKYLPAPAELPAELHWSKWKSYTTWLSGFALLALTYLLSPQIWLIDPNVAALTDAQAISLAVGLLIVGWFVYDLLCRAIGFRDQLLGAVVAVGALALAYATTHLFAGRAAFLMTGAVLATIMSANVLFVIIPGQKRMVAALSRGEAPNPLDGARGKQRSVHNTYFTLPVVFAMLSTHYAPAYAHEHAWMILALFMGAGALIRQFFVLWHSGGRAWWLLVAGGVLLIAAFAWLAPKPAPAPVTAAPTETPVDAQTPPAAPIADLDSAGVQALLTTHCGGCHSAAPKLMPSAPKGRVFDTVADVEAAAALIHQQVVATRVMPPGNMTGMTEEERAAIGKWFEQRQ